MNQTATTHGAIFLNHTPEVQLSVRFTSRDELLKQLCLRAFGAVPTYTEDKQPNELLEKLCELTYGVNPHLQGDDNLGPLACTYTAEEMLLRIHDGLENCKKMPPPQTANDHLFWLGVRRTYETLYRQFTKEKP